MKRLLIVFLLLTVAFTVTATGKQPSPAGAQDREVFEYDTIKILWSNVVADENSLYDQGLLEKFGIKFNVEYLSRAAYQEKIPIMLATGEGIEAVAKGGPGIVEIKQYALEGYLFPMSDYLDKVPNYRKLFDQGEWDIMYAMAKNADGKLYWLPDKRSVVELPLNVVRAGSFKKLAGFVPKTTDELYEAMKKVKETQPDAITHGAWAPMPWDMPQAFRTIAGWYMDADSNKLEFGPSTKKYRDNLIYSAKMFAEGLTDQEWTPAGKQHYVEVHSTGRAYFLWAMYVGSMPTYLGTYAPEDGWTWSADFISAYPGKPGIMKSDMPIHYNGPWITKQCSEEKMERFLEYLNWSATEEGLLFNSFGVEGTTFEFRDGRAVVMSHIKSNENPEGVDLETYGFGGRLLAESKDALIARKGGSDIDFQIWPEIEKDLSKLDKIIAWEITTDQEKELADLETVITDVWKEYTIKFITGILDPSNDTQWNEYLAELERVKLGRVRSIREEAIKKSTLWP